MAGTLKVDTISNLAATGYIGTEGASLDLSNTQKALATFKNILIKIILNKIASYRT